MDYVLWTEKYVLPDDTIKNLMDRYQDPYFLKGDPDWGQHFTSFFLSLLGACWQLLGGFLRLGTPLGRSFSCIRVPLNS